ncbi:thioredoxin domain-containing protein [Ascidiimonas sp. W6]|uniref:thioredoxin domain-containing protein n=1 Tax=Ascidiimonas meishanensis TaxID=3128903 RepID=UPI0030EC5AE6
MPEKKFTNALINESSPYLLQHAHNPVDWFPWNEKSLTSAREHNKLVLISVGYAACHWCHVMEKESFEDVEVAKVMNANFINIKVDREERPDIDQVYMDAVQLMTGAGGWPMNVIALPDGRPFWGGTYFKKNDWISYLNQISKLYKESPAKIEEYANNLSAGITQLHQITEKSTKEFSSAHLKKAVTEWSPYFDLKYGGPTRAPKFMMPVNFEFLLRYATYYKDEEIFSYVHTTLTKMAYGGIYDAIGGGFSRYSVDAIWHVPHFEKMLYDNGQLVSLYANAYKTKPIALYKNVIEETLNFIERELMTPDYAFYSSLDADSLNDKDEMEEGAFYVWTEATLKQLLGKDFNLFKDYYNINEYGLWEDNIYVLIRNHSNEEIAAKHQIPLEDLKACISRCKKLLAEHRAKRPRPRLDDKIITSWNALMLKGYIEAYKALENKYYLEIALKNAHFIKKHLLSKNGKLFHIHKNGHSSINGYLEDYASCADAFISLYEVSSDESWILLAKKLVDYSLAHFYDVKNELFYFTSNEDAPIVTRTIEKNDNVIPASNSIIQKVLFKLSRFFGEARYESIAKGMMLRMLDEAVEYPYSHANWLHNYMNFTNPFAEVVITGKEHQKLLQQLNKHYLPSLIIAGSNAEETQLSLFEQRLPTDETLIYICKNNTCDLPVKTAEAALKKLQSTL